jgi:zinc D-Ala-D-Ala carboxypeptidase
MARMMATRDGAMPARCGTAQRQRVIADSRTLGVPAGYGRARGLRIVREPNDLASIGTDIHGREQWLVPRAARAFQRMREAAYNDAIALQLVSAFRSADYQLDILRRKLERGQHIEEILRVSAAPGYSEHHSGRAVDLTTPGHAALEEEFEQSPAFAWLETNAGRFRFHLSYPRGNRHGIAYEPWHWCWLRAEGEEHRACSLMQAKM